MSSGTVPRKVKSRRHPNKVLEAKKDREPIPFPEADATKEQLLGWLQQELKKRTAGASRVMGLMDDDRSGMYFPL